MFEYCKKIVFFIVLLFSGLAFAVYPPDSAYPEYPGPSQNYTGSQFDDVNQCLKSLYDLNDCPNGILLMPGINNPTLYYGARCYKPEHGVPVENDGNIKLSSGGKGSDTYEPNNFNCSATGTTLKKNPLGQYYCYDSRKTNVIQVFMRGIDAVEGIYMGGLYRSAKMCSIDDNSCPPGATGSYPRCECPNGMYFANNNTCDTCPDGKIWNGSFCTLQCPAGATGIYPSCICPNGFYDSSNNTCGTCSGGKVWNGSSCECSSGTKWNGTSCVTDPSCPAGATGSYPVCKCPSGPYNSNSNTCGTCPSGTTWNGSSCIIDACPAGQVLINGKCTDISGSCSDIVLCSGGESPTYSSEKKKCVCPACSSTKTKCAISTRRVY